MSDTLTDLPAIAALRARLADLPGPALLAAGAIGAGHGHDETGNLECLPALVLRPSCTEEVSRMLAACHDLDLKVVVQGGRTGLSNGATPRAGEVALSLDRMTRLDPVDPVSGSIVAEAGVSLQRVQEAAEAAGLSFGVDIGARGTATVGGICATNAGGLNVIRHGMTRAHVISLEVVLADGRVMGHTRSLAKDNSGPDLKQLFIGSEGILGVITRVCLALRPAPGPAATFFGSAPGIAAARALLARLRRDAPAALLAFEIIDRPLFDRITTAGHVSPIAPGAVQVLVELEEGADPDHLGAVLMEAIEAGELEDATLAASGSQRAALWALREACAEAVFSLTAPVGFDIGLPTAAMEAFLHDARTGLEAALPGIGIYVFGHLGDGNLHYIVDTDQPDTVAQIVFGALAAHGGAISAEHGLGREKAKYLPLVRNAAELDVLRGLKQLLDPRGILNPGRVLP
ncbi:FAD-binding oxidoreductase [Pseudooceanicola sp. CBS1P-1]|uniref:FAD-binding protein n=1 Tax=Pseudooceanicola albus TaxID=2692189 RepID=A0A6L7FZF0_9RHOB|nr:MULTISPECIES: FAD-binding oxidoreductase [Pseudooceanicola]MBT9383959.1 FAD-binding oxidoreductase [Pseudooceanicola endophyticus]MXN16628.1 FAD-binding protein [Pseudooceanicola albus]